MRPWAQQSTRRSDALRTVVPVDVRLATPPDTATRCSADELEDLLIELALDHLSATRRVAARAGEAGACDRADGGPIELSVRERTIDGKPWIEIVRGTTDAGGDTFELRVVEAIATKAGGALARSERRGGGDELVVALPVV